MVSRDQQETITSSPRVPLPHDIGSHLIPSSVCILSMPNLVTFTSFHWLTGLPLNLIAKLALCSAHGAHRSLWARPGSSQTIASNSFRTIYQVSPPPFLQSVWRQPLPLQRRWAALTLIFPHPHSRDGRQSWWPRCLPDGETQVCRVNISQALCLLQPALSA